MPETVAGAWHRWGQATNLDDLPGEQFLLLPKLYANLSRFGLADQVEGRLKGVYRRTWVRNQQLVRATEEILPAFIQSGVPAVLIGDGAACLGLYGSLGERPVHRLDLLTLPAFVGSAADLLIRTDWEPDQPPSLVTTARYQVWVSQVSFHCRGLDPLILHWRILPAAPLAGFEDRFYELAIGSGSTPGRLSSEAQLVSASVHAAQGGRSRLIAAADAGMVLQSSNTINWDRAVELAYLLQAARPLLATLYTVSRLLGFEFDAEVLARLDEMGNDELELEKYGAADRPGVLSLYSQARFHLRRWRRIVRANAGQPTAVGLLRYLQHASGAARLRHLPVRLLQSAVRRPASR